MKNKRELKNEYNSNQYIHYCNVFCGKYRNIGGDLVEAKISMKERDMNLTDEIRKTIDDNIKRLPSIQPDIVRCKDCKHWIPYDWMFSEVWRSKNIADYPEDEIGCEWSDMSMKANDFCSRAERRTDE